HSRRPRALAARGSRQPDDHAQPGEGALVLPLAAGDRDGHDVPHWRLGRERRVSGRRAASGPAGGPAERVALARQEPRRRRGPLVATGAAEPERAVPGAGGVRRGPHAGRHLPARAVLAPVLALAGLARDPHEALTMRPE